MPRSLHSRRLVAEALDILGDLPGAIAAGRSVVGPLRVATLSTEQSALADRLVQALMGWGAVVLAAPVGSGKTWMALHAAAQRSAAVAVIGPAALRHQWHQTASRMGTSISYTSLERVSLGHLPPPHTELILIDEAHRLRNAGTRRLLHLTPWLVGRETIFITGTPIVNGPRDLIRLLRLCLADDCLRLDGVTSLDALGALAVPPRALARLVVCGAPQATQVTIARCTIEPIPSEERRGTRVLALLDRMRLGESAAIGRLARIVLLDAAASSDAAWHASLHRYRTLLDHASRAGELPRRAIRAFIGACPDQGVMWELLRTSRERSQLPVEDIAVLDEALTIGADDTAWISTVVEAIAGRGPALLFTRHLATLRTVRNALGDDVAWASGESAGLGPHRVPRRDVLSAFGPERDRWRIRRVLPDVLILSDVGSEGLDLQGARCVVHLDLPWHDTAMRQRTGRAARIGQRGRQVADIVRLPPTSIGEALGILRTVRRKAHRNRRWMRSLVRSADTIRVPDRSDDLPFDRVAVVTLQCGRRQGTIALGREPGAMGWQLVAIDRVESWQRRGRLTASGALDLQSPGLLEAIGRFTSPAFVARPKLVARMMAVAGPAAQQRRTARVEAISDLVRGASRSHGIGVEQRLVSATLDELLAGAPLFGVAEADEIREAIELIPSVLPRD